ncbi:YihY/virulence factor BrkB family protein [Algiphilus sp.]|uniref:YihY/virulence factor BrkB family protein n=1 Tax=Algiphilus sp. TaxID=1872431 RepID=UPI002A62E7C0|nr:YihY/virulence factor BrkB family protein [Pseudomonadota bacterium]
MRLALGERASALQTWLWDSVHEHRLHRALVMVSRYAVMLVRDFARGELSLRAMSLVYTTLLSLVPMLALAFSLFKAMGVHNALKPALEQFLAPLGERADEVTQNIIGFVENIQVGVLGSLGIGLLLFAAVSLIQKVEASFNWIWRIHQPRTFAVRFSQYLSVLIIGPFAVFLSVGITASVLNSAVVQTIASVEPFGTLVFLLARLTPYLIIIGVFTFLYSFIPNTRVPLHAAFGGGLFAGVLWQTASMGFASFVASSGNYNAVYSSFAILIFLLIWLYVGWLILLLGCQLSFYLGHPENVQRHGRDRSAPPRLVERIGLAIAAETVRRHQQGRPATTRNELARTLAAPSEYVDPVIDALIRKGILAETADIPARILPARAPESLTLAELWATLRTGHPDTYPARASGASAIHQAEQVLSRVDAAVEAQFDHTDLRSWLHEPAGKG